MDHGFCTELVNFYEIKQIILWKNVLSKKIIQQRKDNMRNIMNYEKI